MEVFKNLSVEEKKFSKGSFLNLSNEIFFSQFFFQLLNDQINFLQPTLQRNKQTNKREDSSSNFISSLSFIFQHKSQFLHNKKKSETKINNETKTKLNNK